MIWEKNTEYSVFWWSYSNVHIFFLIETALKCMCSSRESLCNPDEIWGTSSRTSSHLLRFGDALQFSLWKQCHLDETGFDPSVMVACMAGAEGAECDCGQEGMVVGEEEEEVGDGESLFRVPWQVQVSIPIVWDSQTLLKWNLCSISRNRP